MDQIAVVEVHRTLQINILRHNPLDPDSTPLLQRFELEEADAMTLFIALTEIRQTLDPSLQFDFVCRAGICGSCGMIINGRPGLACRTLTQRGFKARNLSGGFKTYCAVAGHPNEQAPATQDTPTQPVKKDDMTVKTNDLKIVHHIDATCMQCPGPIMQLKSQMDAIEDGQAVSITASDSGFSADLQGW